MNLRILRFDSIGSTNTEAASHARRGAEEGLCVVAREQTSGRGRFGRDWVSEKDTGLFLSTVLRPAIAFEYYPLITLAAAVAVHETLKDRFGLEPDIKWPNDVLVEDKKISGILAETVESDAGPAVVLGIGINLSSSHFDRWLRKSSTSIKDETGLVPEPDDLLHSLIRFLFYFYSELNGDDGAEKTIAEWKVRSSYYSGKRVRITTADRSFECQTLGLTTQGALRVITDAGVTEIIQAGDIDSLRS